MNPFQIFLCDDNWRLHRDDSVLTITAIHNHDCNFFLLQEKKSFCIQKNFVCIYFLCTGTIFPFCDMISHRAEQLYSHQQTKGHIDYFFDWKETTPVIFIHSVSMYSVFSVLWFQFCVSLNSGVLHKKWNFLISFTDLPSNCICHCTYHLWIYMY